MVARINGVQTFHQLFLSVCAEDVLGPGQTTLTRIPRSCTIWLDKAREKPTIAPLVEV
jgi:hypothetical protein